MKRLIEIVACVGIVLLVAVPASAQVHVPFGAAATLMWDPPANEQAPTVMVDHYEVRQDGGAYVNANVSVPQATYGFPIPEAWKTVGLHSIAVRACRGTVCGPELGTSYIQDPQMQTPGVPTNPRIVVPPGAQGIAINGVINRLFKEKGLDVAEIAPEGGGQLLVGAAGLRASGFTVRVGDQAGVVVWRPASASVQP